MSKTYTVRTHPAATIPAARPVSQQAAAAKMIRQTLKSAYPSVTFRVRSSGFAGGNSVDIEWTDGPTVAAVDALVSKHQASRYDALADCYVGGTTRQDIPQAQYVQTQRTMSDDAQHAIVTYLNRYWKDEGCALELVTTTGRDGRTWTTVDRATDTQRKMGGWFSWEIPRMFTQTSLVCGACHALTLPGDRFCPDCGQALAKEEAEAA